MSIVKVETSDLGKGRTHTFMSVAYKRLGIELNIDMTGPEGVSKTFPAPLVRFLESLAESDAGPTVNRSSKWKALSDKTIAAHPFCSVCGTTTKKDLVVHHIEPVWVNHERELDPTNHIVLCENSTVLPGFACHLNLGHLGNFRLWNPRIAEVAEAISKQLKAGAK